MHKMKINYCHSGSNMSYLQTKNDMKTKDIEKKFDRLAQMLEEAGPAELASVDFRQICRMLDVRQKDMDRYIYDNFGVSGDEILKAYRFSIPLYLL